MKQFDIFVKNKPGELAKVADLLGGRGINIKAIASETTSNQPLIRIITDDEASTRSALENAKFQFKEIEVMTITLLDRPGELAKIAKKLHKANVNIESIYILERDRRFTTLALTVNDLKRAREVLKK